MLLRRWAFFFLSFRRLPVRQGEESEDFRFQLADFFRFGVKYVEELYSQQPPRNSGGAWKCVILSLCACMSSNPSPTLAALSTAHSRASFSLFHHSISPLLAVISLAVRIVDPFPFIFLTSTNSTRSRRKCGCMEALTRGDIFELYYTSNSY